MPAGAPYPTFSANDTNVAKYATVTFGNIGTYTLTATITDIYGAVARASSNPPLWRIQFELIHRLSTLERAAGYLDRIPSFIFNSARAPKNSRY